MPFSLLQCGLNGTFYFTKMAKGPTILAEKDGRQKAFAVRMWNSMPEHKYRWKEAVGKIPVPESVAKNMDIAAGGTVKKGPKEKS